MEKIKDFWTKYEQPIVLIVSLILVGLVAYSAGYWQGRELGGQPVIIEKASESPQNGPLSASTPGLATDTTPTSGASAGGQITGEKKVNCAYVGSKNSDKFHAPNCQWAKRIKAENLVCYPSREEAERLGKKADAACIK